MIDENYDLGALTEKARILKREYQELLLAREEVAAASTKFRATFVAANTLARTAKRMSVIH